MRFLLRAVLAVIVLLLPACLDNRVVSRAALPGSSAMVVVTEDTKKMYWVRLLNDGKPVSDLKLLGPRHTAQCPPARVSNASSEGIVTIDWASGASCHFVKVDSKNMRMVSSSNLAW